MTIEVRTWLDNNAGAELGVRSNFASVFDGLTLVVSAANGEELARCAYIEHQSPHMPDGAMFKLPPGRTEETLGFPHLTLERTFQPLQVQLVGGLPGTDFASGLESNVIDVRWTSPPRLPAVVDHCTSDDECGVIGVFLDGEYTCCLGCGLATAGRLEWLEEIRVQCEAYLPASMGCPALSCPAGPQHAACQDGQCVPVWQPL